MCGNMKQNPQNDGANGSFYPISFHSICCLLIADAINNLKTYKAPRIFIMFRLIDLYMFTFYNKTENSVVSK